jgi:hypothetical protein
VEHISVLRQVEFFTYEMTHHILCITSARQVYDIFRTGGVFLNLRDKSAGLPHLPSRFASIDQI